jgi:hypothetical protein
MINVINIRKAPSQLFSCAVVEDNTRAAGALTRSASGGFQGLHARTKD